MEEIKTVSEKEYVLDRFSKQGDFNIFSADVVEKMVDAILALNETFMADTRVAEGEFYDDDAAYDFFMEKMPAAFPEQKMYLMRFIDDFMEYDEAYLESTGAIEWE